MRPFGPYRPDQPITTAGVTRNAVGVVPIPDAENGVAYAPYPQLTTPPSATALSEAPRGEISVTTQSGTHKVYVGQSTSIVEMQADWTPTTLDTGLSLTTSDDWSFTNYGSLIIGSNTNYGMWSYNIDTSSGAGAVADAPKARQIFTTNETIVALDCDGDNRRWQNCALGDPTNWSSLEANGDTLEDGGALIAGRDIGNGRALVFQEDVVRIFDFSGGSQFNVMKLAEDVGSAGERSLVAFNGMVFGLDTKGFFVTDGGTPIRIGEGKIDQTFLAQITSSELTSVRAAVDPFKKLVFWAFNGTIWAYNWAIGEWSTLSQSVNALMRVATPGINVDNAAAYGNVDTVAYGPDSRFWQGGAKTLGAFGTDNKIAFFDGDNMAATIDTGVYNSGTSTLITSATPITDDTTATLAVGVSDLIGTALTYGPDISQTASQRVPVRGRGKNIGLREKHLAGAAWRSTRGVDYVDATSGGGR